MRGEFHFFGVLLRDPADSNGIPMKRIIPLHEQSVQLFSSLLIHRPLIQLVHLRSEPGKL
jgi:hypothetical protein